MMSKISSPLFGKFERKHNKFEVIGLFLYSTLREKCLYSEFFRSLFSRIRTEYGDLRSLNENLVNDHTSFTDNSRNV